jgi:hypothetical protein
MRYRPPSTYTNTDGYTVSYDILLNEISSPSTYTNTDGYTLSYYILFSFSPIILSNQIMAKNSIGRNM